MGNFEIRFPRQRSIHQRSVDAFMKKAGQELPEAPMLPSADIRKLRARLILEEALETITALGISVNVTIDTDANGIDYVLINKEPAEGKNYADSFKFYADRWSDLEGVVDGCADIMVVTTGTLSACGVADVSVHKEVDDNNLAKFGPGGYKDENGKWIKPPNHQPPDILRILKEQRDAYEETNETHIPSA